MAIMSTPILIAGVGMVPFVKPGPSETYDVMAAGAIRAALNDARLDYFLIDQAIAGYVYADSCAGERALYRVGMTGISLTNVNNRCASGATALYHARQAVLSGETECALAFGFEEMHDGTPERAFPALGDPLAAWHGGEDMASVCFSHSQQQFALQTQWLKQEIGVTDETFARVAMKARHHARNNPNAIYQDPLTIEELLAAPSSFNGSHPSYLCQPASGAAAVIICSARFAARHGSRTDVAILAHVMGSDVGSDAGNDNSSERSGITGADGGAGSEPPNLPDFLGKAITARVAQLAYERAGAGPADIDIAELHDCSVANELISYASLGFCGEGDIDRFVLSGNNTYGGTMVVCPSGGLLSMGHPPGATGLAQVVELTWQLRDRAGDRQVEGARTALQHNSSLGSAVSVAILQSR